MHVLLNTTMTSRTTPHNLPHHIFLLRAVHYAAKCHEGQTRKNPRKTPYVNHPLAVAARLSDVGIDDVRVLCAAVLHDVIEDTHATEDDIKTRFGTTVAQYVRECSNDTRLAKVPKKQHQIQHVRHISDAAKYIKLADKLDNLTSLLSLTPEGWSVSRVQVRAPHYENICDGGVVCVVYALIIHMIHAVRVLQGYFVWSKQVIDAITKSLTPPLTMSAQALLRQLNALYTKTFKHAQGEFDTIPRHVDENTLLQAYYKELDAIP